MRRGRPAVVPAIVVLVVLAALLLLVRGNDPEVEPTALDERARWLLREIIPGGVASRTEVAETITPALNAYYRDHGEYPPYLFGGPARIRHTLERLEDGMQEIPNPDPLVSGGYLEQYPQVWCNTMWNLNCGRVFYTAVDPRGHSHWKCMFSSPFDLLILSPESRMLQWGLPAEGGQGSGDTGEGSLERELAECGGRYYALGVRLTSGDYFDFSIWPADPVGYRYGDFENPQEYIRGDMPYFGYQRGEWLSADSRECWLWFYGYATWADKLDGPPSNIREAKRQLQDEDFAEKRGPSGTPVPHFVWDSMECDPKGLDLLNAKTGELEPDGIPDHICRLYKLRDGEVIEVVRGDGL